MKNLILNPKGAEKDQIRERRMCDMVEAFDRRVVTRRPDNLISIKSKIHRHSPTVSHQGTVPIG